MLLPIVSRRAGLHQLRLSSCTSPTTTVRSLSSTVGRPRRWDKLVYHPEVEHALSTGQPVVALETAILTHGMPYPLNLDLTLTLSALIRQAGAVPATIGLLGGVPTVGLTRTELERLAAPAAPAPAPPSTHPAKRKISRRDLAPALSGGYDGGTTVAGTMYIAQQAGIDVFVTGGIGGVHRDGHLTLDVSADLTELARTPLAVICAGCKSILDVGRTLEYLETQGVTVATLGPPGTDFPAFYTPASGCDSPWTVGSVEEAAGLIHTALTLPVPLASLIAVPIPPEWAERGARVQAVVEQAVRESVEAGVRGKEATPWLLARVAELTQGASVESNIALIKNNARVGAAIAVRLAALRAEAKREEQVAKPYGGGHVIPSALPHSDPQTAHSQPAQPPFLPTPPAQLVVVGSAAVDLTTRPLSASTVGGSGTTVGGTVALTPGGVGLNVALCADRILRAAAPGAGTHGGAEGRVALVAPRADDAFGRVLAGELAGLGLRTDGLVLEERRSSSPKPAAAGEQAGMRTAVCSLVLDREGGLDGGVADMAIVEALEPPAVIDRLTSLCPSIVAFDGNLAPGTLTAVLTHCAAAADRRIQTAFEPTSEAKATRILPYLASAPSPPSVGEPAHAGPGQKRRQVDLVTPNLLELKALYKEADARGLFETEAWWGVVDGLELNEGWRSKVDRWARRGPGEWATTEGLVQMLTALAPFFPAQLVKLGPLGCVSLRLLPTPLPPSTTSANVTHGRLALAFHPAAPLDEGQEVNTTGAGDSLVGAVLAGLVERGSRGALEGSVEQWASVVERGQRAARASLAAPTAVGNVGGPGWEL